MEILEFRDKILHSLRDFYGHDADVSSRLVESDEKNVCYVGIEICFVNGKEQSVPAICINDYFENYKKGQLNLEVCVGTIIHHRENYRR